MTDGSHRSTSSTEATDLQAVPSPVQVTEILQRTTDFGFLPILPRLRYYENRPQKFGIVLQLTFVAATTFSEYAVGLLFLTPLGDLVHRRPLLLCLVLCSASLSIGLAVTNSVIVFEVLSFFVGVFTVTPQVLLPLAADLAPPHRRAAAISVVFAGLLFGILLARVLAGVIADFSSWRNVYYMAVGLQYLMLGILYFVLPDYPAKSPGIGYFGILKSMVWFAVSEPILIQACIVSCASSATFTSFWVTLTFLLGGPPYHYSDLQIGLFGFIGMLGVATAPFVGRFIDTLVPWNASVLATFIMIVFQAVQTGAGGINIGAVIVACFGKKRHAGVPPCRCMYEEKADSVAGLDVGRQMQQVSLSSAIFAIDATARARINAVYIFTVFLGQLMGTAAGTKVYVQHGWQATALLSLGWMGMQFVLLLMRGPHTARKTWIGWEGGWSLRRRPEPGEEAAETQSEKDTVRDTENEGKVDEKTLS
ncbi:major facilitator superfamily domain-containing protein [Gautieria morchelliformis]|nr:major facilitator superfamily domain-containing protein [Gautieria morchelliformis]